MVQDTFTHTKSTKKSSKFSEAKHRVSYKKEACIELIHDCALTAVNLIYC